MEGDEDKRFVSFSFFCVAAGMDGEEQHSVLLPSRTISSWVSSRNRSGLSRTEGIHYRRMFVRVVKTIEIKHRIAEIVWDHWLNHAWQMHRERERENMSCFHSVKVIWWFHVSLLRHWIERKFVVKTKLTFFRAMLLIDGLEWRVFESNRMARDDERQISYQTIDSSDSLDEKQETNKEKRAHLR